MNLSPLHANPGGIFSIGHYTAGMPIPSTIAKGNQVELRTNTDSLYVEGVELLGDGRYRGRAAFFASSPEATLHGITLGELVEFEYGHIFGCHATGL